MSAPAKARAPRRTAPVEVRAREPRASELFKDIEMFPACLLAGLPLPITLWLDVPGAPVPVCFTTAAASSEHVPLLAPQITFDRDELSALVLGVEADRMWRKELLGLCFEKWRRPALRITSHETLAGAMPAREAEPWTLREVLQRLGAKLERVELPGETQQAARFPSAA